MWEWLLPRFAASTSKTDNFKVRPVQATFCVNVKTEWVDRDGNYLYDDVAQAFFVAEPPGVVNNYSTSDDTATASVCGLTAGTHTISEPSDQNFQIYAILVNGVSLGANYSYTFVWTAGQPSPTIVFQNIQNLF